VLLPERLNSTYRYFHAEVTLDKMMSEVRGRAIGLEVKFFTNYCLQL
jgi:hypothetical protein